MEQYTEKQYDDDLTVVADEYNDSFHTDNVDLFEFPSYDESPIARLKSLVLSIDWEITDDVLRQFNEELLDLKDIWADEKIYLVYVQALEKISKYIYQEKADSNPNAIKLLLTFYYNLEKIISSEDMPEQEKKQLLLEDVKKFEKLKQQISREQQAEKKRAESEHAEDAVADLEITKEVGTKSILLNLKAIVLGIDWEITEKDLGKLRDEVVRLEEVFAGNRAKLIFLQGIGTLGAYIRLKKSDAHADAFKLLHSFFAGLEKIVNTPMSLEEEKAILLPEVEKFNAFKSLVGSTIAPEAGQEEEVEEDEDEDEEEFAEEGGIVPAFSDMPEGETRGFQEEEEAAALGLPATFNVTNQIDMFFSEEPGVDQLPAGVVMPPISSEKSERDEFRDAADAHLDSIFQAESMDEGSPAVLMVDSETALRGVDVETEADDDSGEEKLPLEAGQLAPALAEIGEIPRKEKKPFEQAEEPTSLAGDLESRLDDFFTESLEPATAAAELTDDSTAEGLALAVEPAEPITADEETSVEEWAGIAGVDAEEEETAIDQDFMAIAEGDLTPGLSEGAIAGSEWEAEADFKGPAVQEPVFQDTLAVSLPDTLQDDTRISELPGADEETEVALEDHLDSFFALEEDEEKISGEILEEIAEQQSPAAATAFGLVGETEEMEVAQMPSTVVEFADEQPTELLFEQDVFEAEGENPELTAATDFNLPREEFGEIEATEETSPSVEISDELPMELLFEQEDVSEPEPEKADKTEVTDLSLLYEKPDEEVVFALAEEEDEGAGPEELAILFETESQKETPVEEEVSAFSFGYEPEIASIEEPTLDKTEETNVFESIESQAEFSSDVSEVAESLVYEEEGVSESSPISAIALEDEQTDLLPVFEGVEEEQEEIISSAGAPEIEREPEFVAAETEEEDLYAAEQFTAAEEEISEPGDEEEMVEEEFVIPVSEDTMSNLRACVSSIGIDLSEPIIQGLFKEISALRGKWAARPTEKLFLQLLSTITQHIDQYRYESSSEAFGLLQSVTDGLAESCKETDLSKVQEVLLTETSKVLLWQQAMLNRQAIIKGDALTFAAPIRAQAGQTVDEGEVSFVEEESQDELLAEASAGYEAETSTANENDFASLPTSDEGKAGNEQIPAEESFFSDLEADLASEGIEREPDITSGAEISFDQQLKSMIQQEFATIRQEWKNDLASLRKELKEDE